MSPDKRRGNKKGENEMKICIVISLNLARLPRYATVVNSKTDEISWLPLALSQLRFNSQKL